MRLLRPGSKFFTSRLPAILLPVQAQEPILCSTFSCPSPFCFDPVNNTVQHSFSASGPGWILSKAAFRSSPFHANSPFPFYLQFQQFSSGMQPALNCWTGVFSSSQLFPVWNNFVVIKVYGSFILGSAKTLKGFHQFQNPDAPMLQVPGPAPGFRTTCFWNDPCIDLLQFWSTRLFHVPCFEKQFYTLSAEERYFEPYPPYPLCFSYTKTHLVNCLYMAIIYLYKSSSVRNKEPIGFLHLIYNESAKTLSISYILYSFRNLLYFTI